VKLYYAPRTRAIRPRWLLEEIGVPYELGDVSETPGGEVPVLIDGDITLFDCAAMLLYLADRDPDAQLAPRPGSADRGLYYERLLFAERRVEAAVLEAAGLDVLDTVDAYLAERDVLVGDHFTAADLSMASILHLANTRKLLEEHPRLVAYVYRHCSRPALRRAVS
jgi:glutathione S-transferase